MRKLDNSYLIELIKDCFLDSKQQQYSKNEVITLIEQYYDSIQTEYNAIKKTGIISPCSIFNDKVNDVNLTSEAIKKLISIVE